MFNLGFTELLLLGLIALIFIGPSQLPEVARTVGRLLNEWKRATSDFQNTVTSHLTEDVKDRFQEARQLHADEPVTDHQVADAAHEEAVLAQELPVGAETVTSKKDEGQS